MAPTERRRHNPILVCRFGKVIGGLCHVFDHGIAKFAAFYFAGPGHHPREVVGNGLSRDRTFHTLHNKVGRLGPPAVGVRLDAEVRWIAALRNDEAQVGDGAGQAL